MDRLLKSNGLGHGLLYPAFVGVALLPLPFALVALAVIWLGVLTMARGETIWAILLTVLALAVNFLLYVAIAVPA